MNRKEILDLLNDLPETGTSPPRWKIMFLDLDTFKYKQITVWQLVKWYWRLLIFNVCMITLHTLTSICGDTKASVYTFLIIVGTICMGVILYLLIVS